MRHAAFVLITFFISANAFAQARHFVFIQAENNTPFYVEINKTIYSSTSNGYIIVPRLNNGIHRFNIGFGKNQYPEHNFNVRIDDKDLGFLLKNFGEKGWGLFNFEALDVIMGTKSDSLNALSAANAEADYVITFRRSPKKDQPALGSAGALSPEPARSSTTEVVELPEIMAANSAKPTNASPRDTNAADSGVGSTSVTGKVQADTSKKVIATVTAAITDTGGGIKKIAEKSNPGELLMEFVDQDTSGADTIVLSIPVGVGVDTVLPRVAQLTGTNARDSSIKSGEVAGANTSDVRFLDLKAKKEVTGVILKDAGLQNLKGACKALASDEDYDKLRRKMLNQSTDAKMIAEAQKIYKNKCITIAQAKALSSLFMSDEGRFSFLNISYPYVFNNADYLSLQSQFIDPTYKDRFKALLQ